jgi:hypothetical protein
MGLDDIEFFVYSVHCAADVFRVMWDVNVCLTLYWKPYVTSTETRCITAGSVR